MKKLLAYTRVAKEQIIYSAKLAASLHLALEIDGKFRPLNNNYGILLPKQLKMPTVQLMRNPLRLLPFSAVLMAVSVLLPCPFAPTGMRISPMRNAKARLLFSQLPTLFIIREIGGLEALG